MFDLQYHMGLLILEKKEWTSKYDQMKSSAETADLMRRRDQASHLSALAEARKREESLKKALGVEKECISSVRFFGGFFLSFFPICANHCYRILKVF
jgi:hypothetical protein